MKCPLGISNFLEEISSLYHSIVFLYFFALITWGRLSYLSLLLFGILHSKRYIFPLLFCLLLLFFSQLFVRPPQTAILPLHFFFLMMGLITASCSAAAAAKSCQSCPTLCDPVDGSPPGSPVPGILRARTLEWVAFSFSNAWKRKVKVKSLSRVRLFATPWTAAHQAPPSLGFPKQEYWSGLPLPSPNIYMSMLISPFVWLYSFPRI